MSPLLESRVATDAVQMSRHICGLIRLHSQSEVVAGIPPAGQGLRPTFMETVLALESEHGALQETKHAE